MEQTNLIPDEMKKDMVRELEALEKPAVKTAVAVNKGLYQPKDGVELAGMLKVIAEGGGFPERFKTKEQRIAAYNLARTLMGEQWQLAINHVAIIKGSMSIYGEFPRTLAERTGRVKECHVYAVDKDYKEICVKNKNINEPVFAGVCDIQRQGRKIKSFSYSMHDAEVAEQYPPMKWDKELKKKVPNHDSPWHKFTRIMLMRKAQALAVKMEFPEALVGVPIAEYDYDEAPDLKEVKEASKLPSAADEFNKTYGASDVTKEETNTEPKDVGQIQEAEVSPVQPVN